MSVPPSKRTSRADVAPTLRIVTRVCPFSQTTSSTAIHGRSTARRSNCSDASCTPSSPRRRYIPAAVRRRRDEPGTARRATNAAAPPARNSPVQQVCASSVTVTRSAVSPTVVNVDRHRNDGAGFGERRLGPRIEAQRALRDVRNRSRDRVPAAPDDEVPSTRGRDALATSVTSTAPRAGTSGSAIATPFSESPLRRIAGGAPSVADGPAQHAPPGRKFEQAAHVARRDPALVGNANAQVETPRAAARPQ